MGGMGGCVALVRVGASGVEGALLYILGMLRATLIDDGVPS